MEVRFFKVVYNDYNEYSRTGMYYVRELDSASDIFEDRRFQYVEFAQPCNVQDLDDITGEDSPFTKDENLRKFIEAVDKAESIFCYGEGGGTSFCNYYIVNI